MPDVTNLAAAGTYPGAFIWRKKAQPAGAWSRGRDLATRA